MGTHEFGLAMLLGTPLSPDLAGVAAQCGYFDHAHLDRDFAQFAGINPRGWIAEERRNIQVARRGSRP